MMMKYLLFGLAVSSGVFASAPRLDGQSLVEVKPTSRLTGDFRPQRAANGTLTGFAGFSEAKLLFARSCPAGYCMLTSFCFDLVICYD